MNFDPKIVDWSTMITMDNDFRFAEERVVPPIPHREGFTFPAPVRTYTNPDVLDRLPANSQEAPPFPEYVSPKSTPPRPYPGSPKDNDDDAEFIRRSELYALAVRCWLREKEGVEERNKVQAEERTRMVREWIKWRELYEAEEDALVTEFFEAERKKSEHRRREQPATRVERQEEGDDVQTKINCKRRDSSGECDGKRIGKKARLVLPSVASNASKVAFDGKSFALVQDGQECDRCAKTSLPCLMPLDQTGKKFAQGSCRNCGKRHTKCTYGGGSRRPERKKAPNVIAIIDIDEDNDVADAQHCTSSVSACSDQTGKTLNDSFAVRAAKVADNLEHYSKGLADVQVGLTTSSAHVVELRQRVDNLASIITVYLEERAQPSWPDGSNIIL
ncbi:hypothetical protein VNI00_008944 [Paramarasmius palmivorus]|uniref:Zn(2)-C6 fungal-type domain-containing protein n=1 Tax=Paramarasmius palmivorus TaxID=297713 RepID=A0AAW0CPH3_9AGAR